MMYNIVKTILKVGFLFFYKSVKIIGRDHIPKKGAVLFIPNHPNALIDPLLVAYKNPRVTSFLTRASVFGNPLVDRFFDSVNMLPIYRPRDGADKMHLNEAIFEKCETLLGQEKGLMIFAEGSHNNNKQVRPLKTGFARIALRTLDKFPEIEDIQIVPVGINYDNPTKAWSRASVYFGPPISVQDVISGLEEQKEKIQKLCAVTQKAMQPLSIHIESNYEENFNKLKNSAIDLSDPYTSNSAVKTQKFPKKQKNNLLSLMSKLIYYASILLNLIPFLIWSWMKPKVADEEFQSTFKFAICMTILPLNLMVLSLIIGKYYLIAWIGLWLLSKTNLYRES